MNLSDQQLFSYRHASFHLSRCFLRCASLALYANLACGDIDVTSTQAAPPCMYEMLNNEFFFWRIRSVEKETREICISEV